MIQKRPKLNNFTQNVDIYNKNQLKMDKNIIKNHLIKRFISEAETPGISVTAKAQKESGKFNKAGVKAIEKDVTAYDKSMKKEDPDMGKMATNKYNYTNDAEKTYHEEMEILNGQEMIKYDREPGKEFSQRAKESLEGSSRMGNKGGKDMGNAEETWGSAKDSFGKDLVNRIKASEKKRNIADAPIDSLTSLGDKIAYPNDKVSVSTDKTAMSGGVGKNNKGDNTPQTKSAVTKTKTKTVKENNDNNNPQIVESMKRIKFNKNGDKPFKGANLTQKLGHALTLIPEGYKVDNKEFEMTDGNVTCRVRWEGNLNEGKAIVLTAKDRVLVNEDIARMQALFNYKSEDTLGTVKGKSRIDENTAFADIWKKSKALLGEAEDIEDADVKETGDLDDAVNVAPEAKKDIEGSVATEKKTNAPEPKKGEWEKISVPQASEAKKHVEGSVATEKKTNAPAPKEGNWEDISKKAPEATSAVESGKPTNMATNKAKVVKAEGVKLKGIKLGENYFEPISEEEETEEPAEAPAAAPAAPAAPVAAKKKVAKPAKPESDDDGEDADVETSSDKWNKSSEDDNGDTEKEPTASEIPSGVPDAAQADDNGVTVPPPAKGAVGFLKSPTNPGKLWIKINGKPEEVPQKYMELAQSGNPKAVNIITDKMEMDALDAPVVGGPEDEVDETQGMPQGIPKAAPAAMPKPSSMPPQGMKHENMNSENESNQRTIR